MVSRGSRRRVSNIVGSVTLLMASLLVSALLLEGILRLMGFGGAPVSSLTNTYGVADPILDWRYVPNSEVRVGKVAYRFNRAGFRDIDHSSRKPAGVRRIVVIGDSVTEGYGVSLEEMFSTRVQKQLGDRWEIITVAAGGLNTPQQVHLLEREGLAYGPDLVVVNFVMNDPEVGSRRDASWQYDAAKASQIGFLNLPINPELKGMLKSSALLYFVKERLEHLVGLASGNENTDYYSKLLQGKDGRARVASAFRRLAELQKTHGFDVAVVIWPILTQYDGYRFQFAHEWVASEAAIQGFPVIDLLPHFARVSHRTLQVTAEDSIHPNSRGHQLGVEAFLDWHRSRRWE